MCFFFLMIRRPPRSTRTDTLVPYTTLFLSQAVHQGDILADVAGPVPVPRADLVLLGVQVLFLAGDRRRLAQLEAVVDAVVARQRGGQDRSEEHTSELQSLMRISYAVFCLKKKKNTHIYNIITHTNTTV